jgi:hypothetical protein
MFFLGNHFIRQKICATRARIFDLKLSLVMSSSDSGQLRVPFRECGSETPLLLETHQKLNPEYA